MLQRFVHAHYSFRQQLQGQQRHVYPTGLMRSFMHYQGMTLRHVRPTESTK
jgi:hypothetical protein